MATTPYPTANSGSELHRAETTQSKGKVGMSVEDDAPVIPETAKQKQERLELLDSLGKKIEAKFEERAVARLPKEAEWDQSLRLYNSPLTSREFSTSDDPFGTKSNGKRRPVPNIVRTKCDTAIANQVSLQFAAGEKNWDLFPPANATDPAVTEGCRLMEKEIETQLADTKYAMQARRAMSERVILGTGVLKGPVNSGKLRVAYDQSASGEWIPKVTEAREPRTEWVTLWRFYPDMSVTDFSEAADAIELHPMTPLELSAYRSHPGFDRDAINRILKGDERYDGIKPDAYNEKFTRLTAEVWSRSPYLYKNRYQVLEYHGPVTYDELCKLGVEPTYESPTLEYYGEVWVCCGQVIRMELENIEGYCETPYSVAIWKRDPTSPFGFGHPQLLADSQRVVTQSYHMILDNASLTSGSQVAMYRKFIQPADGSYDIGPNKVWFLTDPTVQIDHAIKFFNPTNNIPNIMPVLDLARQFAEEESATSSFQGTQSPMNQESATGALLMQHSSTTLLDYFAEEWDDQVTEKLIRRYYAWNMQYNPKNEIKGDYSVDVKSASEYKNKQMYIRDLERLSMEVANNPSMSMVVNVDELAKARLQLMHLPSNRIVKTDQEIQAAQQEAAQRPDPQMLELQVKQADAETSRMKVELEQQRMQFETQQQQQRELWEHEEKMGSNYARAQEAQAQVIKARSEAQVEILKLAQKDNEVAQRLMNDREMQQLSTNAEIFLKSMEENRKERENLLFAKELELKNKTGSGI